MSLLLKRRMQERERRNGLADQVEVPNYNIKPVEPQRTSGNSQSWSFMNNGVGGGMPLIANNNSKVMEEKTMDHFQVDGIKPEHQQQPTMPHQMEHNVNIINSQSIPGWTISTSPEGYQPQQQVSAVDNNPNILTSLPQGSYYDCPIIIDPVSYQQQQTESFNGTPQNLTMQQPQQIQQTPGCINVNCQCKPANVNTS